MGSNGADRRPLVVLVPGGRGQLGSDLALRAVRYGRVFAPGSTELDVTDMGSITSALDKLVIDARTDDSRPVVVNAAAYTAVDAAETDVARATAVNATAPGLLAAACAQRDVPLLHVSTDYVFPGDADRPYEVADETGPRSVYGRTKLAGEQAVLAAGGEAWIVRTAWVYGGIGGNFVKTMARLAAQGVDPSVVDDQRGAPTWSADLAEGLLALAELAASGGGPKQRVLHCTGGGETTWFGFARAIFAELGFAAQRVRPCTTDQFPRPAPRPAYSVLSAASWLEAGLTPLPAWSDSLAAFVAANRSLLMPEN